MGIKVVIDHREGKMKATIPDNMIDIYNIQYANLEHGDVIIYYDDVPILVFERKTILDLVSSIHDGRYRNQKIRMLELFSRENIYYIIEGDSYENNKSVNGAIINTMIRDKICVFRTKNVTDTLDLMYDIFERVLKDPYKYFANKDDGECQQAPTNRNETTFINMLCQIPHISLKTAKAISEHYSSSYDLVTKLSNKTCNEKLNTLKSILTLDSRGKSRKISKTACANIVKEYFVGNGEGESATLQ